MPSTRRARAWAASIVIATLTGAGAHGLLSGPSPGPGRAGAPGAGPRTDMEGIPTGFADTREGALDAAVSDVRQGQRIYDLAPARRPDVLRGMASAAAADAYVAEESQALGQLDAAAARGQGPLTWLVTVAATRVDAYERARARVSLWRVGVVSVAGLQAPLAEWTTVTIELVWERGDWRIWSETQTAGPTPTLHPSESLSNPDQLRTALAGFQRYPGTDPL